MKHLFACFVCVRYVKRGSDMANYFTIGHFFSPPVFDVFVFFGVFLSIV